MSQSTKEIKKIGINKLWSKKTLQKLYIIPIISKCRATCGTSYRYRKQGALGRKPNQTHVLVYTNKPSPFLMFLCSYVLKIHQVSLVLMFLCLKYKPCSHVLLSLIFPRPLLIMSPCLKNVLLALLVLSKTFSNFASNNNASSLWQIILYGRTTTGCC